MPKIIIKQSVNNYSSVNILLSRYEIIYFYIKLSFNIYNSF